MIYWTLRFTIFVISILALAMLVGFAFGGPGLLVVALVGIPVLGHIIMRRPPESPKPTRGVRQLLPGAAKMSLSAYEEARQYADLDDATIAEAGPRGAAHARFHWIIVAVSILLGLASLAVGVAHTQRFPGRGTAVILVLFAIGGALAGAALMILLAPTDFLRGPVGRRWLKLVGSSNLLAVRLICLLLAAVLIGIVAAVLIPIL